MDLYTLTVQNKTNNPMNKMSKRFGKNTSPKNICLWQMSTGEDAKYY